MIWSGVWLKPAGTVRLLAIRLGGPGEAGLAPEGIAHYQLPARGTLRLEAVQAKVLREG